MADRTDAFLARIKAFLDNDFTGEIVLHCNRGVIRSMDLKQQIRVAEEGAGPGIALIQPSSALTAVVGRT